MNPIENLREQFRTQSAVTIKRLKGVLFGANNERLDFLMDSFYKLPPPQRSLVLSGIVGTIVCFVLLSVWLYFSQLNALKMELNNSFRALHELHVLEAEHEREQKRFDRLVESIDRKSRNLKMKPFIEQVANQQTVQVEGLNEQKVAFPPESPFAAQLEQTTVEMSFPKVSVPKLLNFLIEIEKSGNYLALEDLQIRSRYGTKLHFSANAKIKGYRVNK